MAKAIIVLEDGKDGEFTANTSYEGVGGFEVESHAHQMALLLVKHLGVLAERKGETTLIGNAVDPFVSTNLSDHIGPAELAIEMDGDEACHKGAILTAMDELAKEMDNPEIAAVPIETVESMLFESEGATLTARLDAMRLEADRV